MLRAKPSCPWSESIFGVVCPSMKYALIVAALMGALLSTRAAETSRGATYIGHARVAAAASGADLAVGPDFTVMMMKRTGPGHVEVHAKETDTFFVLDGDA